MLRNCTTDTWLCSFAVFFNSVSTTIQFQAVVTHPNKKPAVGVRVLMAANFTRGKDKSMEVNQKFDRDDPNSIGHTDLNGEVDFAINTQSNYHLIIIKVQKKITLFVCKKRFGYSSWQTQLDVFKWGLFLCDYIVNPLTVPNVFVNCLTISQKFWAKPQPKNAGEKSTTGRLTCVLQKLLCLSSPL